MLGYLKRLRSDVVDITNITLDMVIGEYLGTIYFPLFQLKRFGMIVSFSMFWCEFWCMSLRTMNLQNSIDFIQFVL